MTEIDANERNWGMACHISALSFLAIWGVGQIIGPLVIWLFRKEKLPFVADQGKESLNFQITMTIIGAAAYLIGTFGKGDNWPWLAVALIDLVAIVYAAVQASKGIYYRYPFSLKLVN
jgi:uncharacterized Tic20 family protein